MLRRWPLSDEATALRDEATALRNSPRLRGENRASPLSAGDFVPCSAAETGGDRGGAYLQSSTATSSNRVRVDRADRKSVS